MAADTKLHFSRFLELPSMSHASRSAHIADLIDDLADLSLAQAADLREFAQATEAGGCPQRARSARGQLMFPSGQSASANLYVPGEPTSLLYKERSETIRRARRDTDSLKHLQLGLGENLPAQGPNEASW
jgi:hypothetical protein